MEEQSKAIVEGKPLEYPEIVQDTVEVEFPEITDFVRNMKLKSGIFGFQKEDVYEKMQQLNKMYQSRAQQMRDQNRGQLKQMRKQQQEELEDMKARLAASPRLSPTRSRSGTPIWTSRSRPHRASPSARSC